MNLGRDPEQQGAASGPGRIRPGDRGAAGRALHFPACGRPGPRSVPGRPAGAAESQRRKTSARGPPSCCRRSARPSGGRCRGGTTTSACWPAVWKRCTRWSWRPTCWAATSRPPARACPSCRARDRQSRDGSAPRHLLARLPHRRGRRRSSPPASSHRPARTMRPSRTICGPWHPKSPNCPMRTRPSGANT